MERLKDRLVSQEDPEANRLVDLLRKRRRERLGNESDHKFTPLPPTNTAMKTVERRLDRLEDRLAPQGRKQFLIVVTDAAQKLALDSDRCVQILREAGRIDSASPIIVVDLGCIPDGLNAAELERYLREHGARTKSA